MHRFVVFSKIWHAVNKSRRACHLQPSWLYYCAVVHCWGKQINLRIYDHRLNEWYIIHSTWNFELENFLRCIMEGYHNFVICCGQNRVRPLYFWRCIHDIFSKFFVLFKCFKTGIYNKKMHFGIMAVESLKFDLIKTLTPLWLSEKISHWSMVDRRIHVLKLYFKE